MIAIEINNISGAIIVAKYPLAKLSPKDIGDQANRNNNIAIESKINPVFIRFVKSFHAMLLTKIIKYKYLWITGVTLT